MPDPTPEEMALITTNNVDEQDDAELADNQEPTTDLIGLEQ